MTEENKDMNGENGIQFDVKTDSSSIIKVVGVGGGGGNAVNHMYRQAFMMLLLLYATQIKRL